MGAVGTTLVFSLCSVLMDEVCRGHDEVTGSSVEREQLLNRRGFYEQGFYSSYAPRHSVSLCFLESGGGRARLLG